MSFSIVDFIMEYLNALFKDKYQLNMFFFFLIQKTKENVRFLTPHILSFSVLSWLKKKSSTKTRRGSQVSRGDEKTKWLERAPKGKEKKMVGSRLPIRDWQIGKSKNLVLSAREIWESNPSYTTLGAHTTIPLLKWRKKQSRRITKTAVTVYTYYTSCHWWKKKKKENTIDSLSLTDKTKRFQFTLSTGFKW